MILLTMTFWLRTLATTIAIGFVSAVVTSWGGIGPCGFTQDWQFAGLATFLPCLAAACVAVAMLAAIGAVRLLARGLAKAS